MLEDERKVFAKTSVGLRTPIRRHIIGTLELKHEYDSGAAGATDDSDLIAQMKLGYEW